MPQLRKEEKILIKPKPKKQLTVKSSKLLNLDAIEEIQTKNNQQTTQKILAQIQARAKRSQQSIEEGRKTTKWLEANNSSTEDLLQCVNFHKTMN